MDLVEVEVAELQLVAVQQLRHRVGGGHQQALVAADVVDGGRRDVRQVGEHRDVVGLGPLLAGQQHRGGAVGQRGRVARGHGGALALAEHRLELGELVHRAVRAQVLVLGHALERGDQVVEEAAVVGGGEPVVAARGQLVLGFAGDLPGQRGLRRVLTHGQTGARLGVLRDLRHHVLRPGAGQRLDLGAGGLGVVGLEQHPAEVVVDRDGGVAGGVHTAADADLDLAERDLVGDRDDRFQPGRARHLHVVGGRARVELGAQHGFAGEVEVAAVLEHGAGDELVDGLVREAEPRDQPVERGGEHVLVGRASEGTAGSRERDPIAAEDRDSPNGGHDYSLVAGSFLANLTYPWVG